MAKWVLDQWDGVLDYPALGFVAEPGDILSASAAPSGYWSLNGDQGAAETVTRYTIGGDPSYVEPGDGHVLTWSDEGNTYVPTARSVFVEEDFDTPMAAVIADTGSDSYAALSASYVGVVKGLVPNDSSAPVKAANAAILDAATTPGSHAIIPRHPLGTVTYYTDEFSLVGPVTLVGEDGATSLRNNSGSVLAVQGTGIRVSNIYLRSDGGGHTVHQTGGVDQGHWDKVTFWQGGDGYSVWDNDSAGSQWTLVDNEFSNFQSWHTQTATVPTWKLVGPGGGINANRWRRFRQQFTGNYAFWIESTDANAQLDNSWTDPTWEVCSGGLIRLISCRDYLIDGGGSYDVQIGSGGHDTLERHGIYATANASNARCVGTIRRHRRYDTNAPDGGIYDIKLPAGNFGDGTVIDNCRNISSGNPLLVDLAGNVCTVTLPAGAASTPTTFDNSGGATFFDRKGVSVASTQVLRTGAAVTGSRPSAATMGAGAVWFDTTLGRPIWSDGTTWHDNYADAVAAAAADATAKVLVETNRALAAEAAIALSGNPYGFTYTVDPGLIRGSDAVGAQGANQGIYARVPFACTISKIGLQVAVSSGNISVAAYSNSGTARAAVPGTRLATSGAVTCPAVGYQEISLGSSVNVAAGDWLAISADNTTATFRSLLSSTLTTDLGKGRQMTQTGAHPLPSTPSSLAATVGYTIVLIGIP